MNTQHIPFYSWMVVSFMPGQDNITRGIAVIMCGICILFDLYQEYKSK